MSRKLTTLLSWLRPAAAPARRHPGRARPQLLPLEDRCTPAAFVVDRITDDAADGAGTTGSLRFCIAEANATAGDDTITFDPAVNGQTIPVGDAYGIASTAAAGKLTITGPGADQLTLDGATSTTGIFANSGGADTAIAGLRLSNSNGGGAVLNAAGATLVLDGMYIDANTNANANGGGINNDGSMTVDASLIVGNQATSGNPVASNGGGIYNGPAGVLFVSNTTIANNSANTTGGGVMNDNPTAGGANPTLRLVNCTVVGNAADADGDGNGDGGGLFTNPAGETSADNTIFGANAQDPAAGAFPSDVGGLGAALVASNNNIVVDAASAGGLTDGTNGNIVGVGIDQVLDLAGGLVDLGGALPAFNLEAGGRAIDTGNNKFAVDAANAALTDDQRGTPFVRVSNGTVDIGAVEIQAAPAGQPPVPPPAAPPAGIVGLARFTASADTGGASTVTLFNPDKSVALTAANTFPGFTGGVRSAAGDFNGDGVIDIAVGTGPGAPARVRVLSGKDQSELFSAAVLEGFTGGVFITAGDVTGDKKDDLIITPDLGGGPRVLVISGGDFKTAASFFGITDPLFRGGARAGVGDMNGDGRVDIAVAAGFQGGPRVTVFDGKTVGGATPKKLFGDIFVFADVLRNGVYVALGDVNGDGFADLIAGAGPGGGPRVLTLSGKDLLAGKANGSAVLTNFFGGDPNNRSGIRVATKNLDGDARADLVVGAGGGGSRVTGYLGKNFAGAAAAEQLAFDAFPGFTGGVFVG